MHNAVMCTLSLYDVIGITRRLHIKLKSFSNIAQLLHKEAVRRCSFSFITAKKSVIMSEAFFVDVSIYFQNFGKNLADMGRVLYSAPNMALKNPCNPVSISVLFYKRKGIIGMNTA